MSAILAIVRALLSVPAAFLALVLALWRLLVSLFRGKPKPPGRLAKAAPTRCVPIEDPAMVTPDPLLYSQYDLMARGIAVTWDNPDFGIFLGPAKVDSHQLAKDTEYTVVVRVWNASADCPAVLMPVHLSFLDFGIGTVAKPIGTTTVDVGVKGAPDNPAFVQFTWRTPPADGHYCLQALLNPVSDLNFGNNLGQHNTNVVEAHSPAVFSFPLRNNTQREHPYRFEADVYTVTPHPCLGERGEAEHQDEVPARGKHPVPAGWTVELSPPNVVLAPGAQVAVTAKITPPTGFTGRQVINIHAYYPENYTERAAGGVSVTVTGT